MKMKANANWFSGIGHLYDRFRPCPPEDMARIAEMYVPPLRNATVVDLGSGTGLSSRYWAQYANTVIGIEPNDEMREIAKAVTRESNISYHSGFGEAVPLTSSCADIVTCFQSLHLMEPDTAFQEARRLLKPNGLFIAADYDWPPAIGVPKLEGSWLRCLSKTRSFEAQLGTRVGLVHWDQKGHEFRMRKSGHFTLVRELCTCHHDSGSAERFIGAFLTQATVANVLKHGISEHQLGIDVMRQDAESFIGKRGLKWLWSSRIRLGIV